MHRAKLAISLEGLGVPLRRGLQEAQRLSVTGVELTATGDLTPRNLSRTGRLELRQRLRSHNLELTALHCPLRRGLDTAEAQQARIEHVQAVMSLSYDLGARLVVVPFGGVPEDLNTVRGRLLTEAMLALGHHGDRTGTVLALESGFDAGSTLRTFLERFDTGGLGVTLDPANLLLHQQDPYASTRALAQRVGYVHARDARRTSPSRSGQEVPLGHGDIEWMQFLSVLEEIEYRGWLTIVRETGEQRLADVGAGVKFLRRFLPEP
jgi:sugar phosphate isomerase/epimerase